MRLRHRHAVTGDDDDAVSLVQRRRDPVGIDGDLFTLDLLRGAGRIAEAAQDHGNEAAVHRLAHDIGQDRPRGADKRPGHDKQVIAEAETDRRRRPPGIGVEHRDHHRHIRAADPHDQVIADEERQQRHHQKWPERARVEIDDQQDEGRNRRPRVEQMPTRKLGRRRAEFARQLAKGHHRTGKGHRADKDAEKHFDPQDVDLDRVFLGQKRGKAGEVFLFRRFHRQNPAQFDIGVKADKDRRQTDEAVHRRHKLRHLGHLDALRDHIADDPAARDEQHRQQPQARARPDQRRKNREPHADDPVPDRALGAFLA